MGEILCDEWSRCVFNKKMGMYFGFFVWFPFPATIRWQLSAPNWNSLSDCDKRSQINSFTAFQPSCGMFIDLYDEIYKERNDQNKKKNNQLPKQTPFNFFQCVCGAFGGDFAAQRHSIKPFQSGALEAIAFYAAQLNRAKPFPPYGLKRSLHCRRELCFCEISIINKGYYIVVRVYNALLLRWKLRVRTSPRLFTDWRHYYVDDCCIPATSPVQCSQQPSGNSCLVDIFIQGGVHVSLQGPKEETQSVAQNPIAPQRRLHGRSPSLARSYMPSVVYMHAVYAWYARYRIPILHALVPWNARSNSDRSSDGQRWLMAFWWNWHFAAVNSDFHRSFVRVITWRVHSLSWPMVHRGRKVRRAHSRIPSQSKVPSAQYPERERERNKEKERKREREIERERERECKSFTLVTPAASSYQKRDTQGTQDPVFGERRVNDIWIFCCSFHHFSTAKLPSHSVRYINEHTRCALCVCACVNPGNGCPGRAGPWLMGQHWNCSADALSALDRCHPYRDSERLGFCNLLAIVCALFSTLLLRLVDH